MYPNQNQISVEMNKIFLNNPNKIFYISELYEPLADSFGLTQKERSAKTATGSEPKWNNDVRWAKEILKSNRKIKQIGRGLWQHK